MSAETNTVTEGDQTPPPWRPAGAKRLPPGAETLEQTLADVRQKIYPRSVSGQFARLRILMVWLTQIFFYGLPWLSWNDRQAVLFDLGARKFYIFGMVLWPQDVIYLTLLLIISALGLFLFTAVAGSSFLRLCLPPDGVHRNFHVDRAQDRGGSCGANPLG